MRFLPRGRRGVLWRAVLAGVLVICCTAGAVTTASLLQVKDVADDFVNPAIKDAGTTLPKPGAPETLLLVGSDKRWHQTGESNTDTMMLVRINDASSTINLLSVPRDLEVTVDGQDAKLNSAWSAGGPKLLIDTLATQVFPDTNFQVTHIINVDFSGFSDLVDAIGCVYTMVDQRYYNHSVGAADPTTDYSSIDIQPGYQKLCGNVGSADSALAFVRFRHNDSDLVRESRQQDFIRWARDQFSTSKLLSDRNQLLSIFGKHVSADKSLTSETGLLDLFDLAINANGHDLKSIEFPTTGNVTVDGADDLGFETSQSVAAYKEFMAVTPTKSTTTTTTTTTTSTPKTARTKTKAKAVKRSSGSKLAIPAGMAAESSAGQQQASDLDGVSIPVYYPRYIPDEASYCFSSVGNCDVSYEPAAAYAKSYPRSYTLRDRSGHGYSAYVMTLVTNAGLGEYVNVQGSAWQTPPILNKPTKTVTVDGRRLEEYYNAGELSLVAWHTRAAVYWIANTLQDDVPANEMIAMAASLERAR